MNILDYQKAIKQQMTANKVVQNLVLPLEVAWNDLSWLVENSEQWELEQINQTPAWNAVRLSIARLKLQLAPVLMTLGVAEEAGEICHALLKHEQGVRGYDKDEIFKPALLDAIGDTGVYLMELCEAMGWDFEEVLKSVAQHVLDRNSKGYPKADEEIK